MSDGWRCDGPDAVLCAGEDVTQRDDCRGEGQMCVEGSGCQVCVPGSLTCDEQDRVRCLPDGTGYEVVETCGGSESCTREGCADLCEQAAERRSYIGCDYWPVTTANSLLDSAFEPALAIGNPNLQTAHVTLSRGGEEWTLDVPPGGMDTLAMPFDAQLKVPYARDHHGEAVATEPRSMLVRGGAYHLVSSVPITVHQFNPLEYMTERCEDEEESPCYSLSNDASLLLPTTALTGNYMAVTRPTFLMFGLSRAQRPGFVAVVGTQERPTEVEIRAHAYVAPSIDGGESLPPLTPGQTLRVTLGAGDVLQLASAGTGDLRCPGRSRLQYPFWNADPYVYCDPGADYDLTGTEIHADAPVEVIAGHDCTFVPYGRWACDHLEETMLPLESWGREIVATQPERPKSQAYQVKVVSASDGNRFEVDPPLPHPLVLHRGESFEWEAEQPVMVRGDAPFTLAQFLQSQGENRDQHGDPSMTIGVPVAQFKKDYAILAPRTFEDDYVNIVAPKGARVTLNDRIVGGFLPLGESDYEVAHQRIDSAGLYRVESDRPVGVTVYGFARYTSYMVPGGLDLSLLQASPN